MVDRLDPQLESLERTMDRDSVKLRKLGIPWGPEQIEAVKVASLKLAEVGAYPGSYSTMRTGLSRTDLKPPQNEVVLRRSRPGVSQLLLILQRKRTSTRCHTPLP